MKRERGIQGFTMTELITVIAIIGVVSAIAFVAAGQYLRTMYQVEMDGTAKEIYMASQNHLRVAEAMGYLNPGQTEPAAGDPDAELAYIIVGPGAEVIDGDERLFDQMLPYGSIDETVRGGGTYYISYEPNTATIRDVFYAEVEPSGLFARYGLGRSFSEADKEVLFGTDSAYRGNEDAQKQNRYNGFGDNNAIIGYYGGEPGDDFSSSYKPLKVEIINKERLIVRITGDDLVDANNKSKIDPNAVVSMTVEGKTNSAKAEFILTAESASSNSNLELDEDTLDSDGEVALLYCLDDVTDSGFQHFADIEQIKNAQPVFVPGENITVQAVMYKLDKLGIKRSNRADSNSLFESAKDSGSVAVVGIANFRHLENLDPDISGYVPHLLETKEATGWVKAEQVVDLAKGQVKKTTRSGGTITKTNESVNNSWTGFKEAIASGKASYSPNQVSVRNLRGNIVSTAGTYLPVNANPNETGFALEYDGQSHIVSDVVVDVGQSSAQHAGLFGSATGAKIHDLELVDFNIKTANGDAGALAGTLANSEVSNVLVHDEDVVGTAAANAGNGTESTSGGDVTVSTNADDTTAASYLIQASGNAGGLVGSMTGNSTVAKCAAAVLVESTGNNGVAGGLVGAAGSAAITDSYSGGHTVEGAYEQLESDEQSPVDAERVLFGGYDPAKCNVKSQGVAGGLVGTTSAAVSNCYSTCSVSGATAGGLVGTSNSSISNCYSLGAVAGVDENSAVGALAGTAGSFANSSYLEIINGAEVFAVSNPSNGEDGKPTNPTGVSTIDETAKTFNDFAMLGTADSAKANPYDETLAHRYVVDGVCHYMYQTIKQLDSSVDDSTGLKTHLNIHYGDWPSPETLVVNVAG